MSGLLCSTVDENERRLQVSLRMKAARHLAGYHGSQGATPMPITDVVTLGPLLDEQVSSNRLTEIEQMKVSARRSELDAFVAALGLPADWFSGLYQSDRGQAVSDSLGALLQAVAADVLELRQAREAAAAQSRGRGRRKRGGGGGAG